VKKSLILSYLLLLSVCLSGWTSAKSEATDSKTIYLIRHAEKSNDDRRDPNLSSQGLLRAGKLARFFAGKQLSAIYSSNYKRTLQTAKPAADTVGVGVQLYNPSKLAQFAETLKRTPGNLLVVGHSNTTPELARLIGFGDGVFKHGGVRKGRGEDWREIDEADFSRIYQIQFNGEQIDSRLLSSDALESEAN